MSNQVTLARFARAVRLAAVSALILQLLPRKNCAGIEFPISYPILHSIYPVSLETIDQES